MSGFDGMTDLLEQGCLGAFAEDSDAVTFKPAGGVAHTVPAIFDRAALVVETGGEFGVSAYKPMVSFAKADFMALSLAAPTQGDTVTIDSVAYTVVEPQHDGRSEYRCILSRA